jgi:hypothetical protein
MKENAPSKARNSLYLIAWQAKLMSNVRHVSLHIRNDFLMLQPTDVHLTRSHSLLGPGTFPGFNGFHDLTINRELTHHDS